MRQLLLRSIVPNHVYRKQHSLHRHSGFASSSTSSSSTSTPSSPPSPVADGHKILTKTIYRQLLRWCASTGYDVPLSPLPPLHLTPPTVDATSLRALAQAYHQGDATDTTKGTNGDERTPTQAQAQNLLRLLPRNTVLNERKLTLTLNNTAQVRDVTRLIYRLNSLQEETKNIMERDQQRNERVSLGFEALRSLNQLTDLLDERKEKREAHQDRTGVHYRVGQGESFVRMSWARKDK